MKSIHDRLTKPLIPSNTNWRGRNIKGVVDLIARKAHTFNDDLGVDIQEIDVPEDMKEQVEEHRAKLEAVAEYDEAVMNKFWLAKKTIEEIKKPCGALLPIKLCQF